LLLALFWLLLGG